MFRNKSQNSPVLQWPPKISTVSSYPYPHPRPPNKNIHLSDPSPPQKKRWNKNKLYWNSKFEPLKWPKSTYIWKYNNTFRHPPGITPSSTALCSVFVDFPLAGIMKLWTKFLTQLEKDILSVTWLVKCVLWLFNERFVRCIYGTYSFCLLYIRYLYGNVH